MYGRAFGKRPPLIGGYMKNNKYEKQTSWMKNAPGWSTKKAMLDTMAYGGDGVSIDFAIKVALNIGAFIIIILISCALFPDVQTVEESDRILLQTILCGVAINGLIFFLKKIRYLFLILKKKHH